MPLPMFQQKKEKPLSEIKHIIAIAAGKGGVGKSTIAVNLALGLKAENFSVGLMDADIYGPSIRRMMPEEVPPAQKGQIIIPALYKGIPLISMAYFRKENEAAAVRAPIANGVIQQFIKNVAWGSLDFLIVDLPPGTGDVQLTLCQSANLSGAVMVTTPQEVALMDVRKAMHLFEQLDIPILGVVENMSGYYQPEKKEILYLFGKGGGEKLAMEKGAPFLGAIPIDPEICLCGDEGFSLFERNHPESRYTIQAFRELARSIAQSVKTLPESPLKSIVMKNPLTLSIEWKDGSKSDILFADLQRHCPCAKCFDETTGRRISDPSLILDNVSAKKIQVVGRYALKFDFTMGCSTGIFRFDLLKSLAKEPS